MFIKFLFVPDLQLSVGIIEFIKPVFRTNSKVTARDNDYQNLSSHLSLVFIGLPNTILYLAITGEYRPPYGMYLPGLDADQWTHCMILCFFNFTYLLIDLPILSAFDSLIFITFNNMFVISKIIPKDINDLGKMLTEKSTSENKIKSQLTSIIRMHVEYNS